MTSSSEGFLNYTVESEGRHVETANGKLLPAAGCGQLEIVAKQPGVPVTISLGKVLHVPKLERKLICERRASLMFGLLFVKIPMTAHLGTVNGVCCYFSYSPSPGLCEITEMRRKATPERALTARAPPQRDHGDTSSSRSPQREHHYGNSKGNWYYHNG